MHKYFGNLRILVVKFPLPEGLDINIIVIETLLFHSTWRYHLDTFILEFYYVCDCNSAAIIAIVRQTKKMICLEKYWFSTLTWQSMATWKVLLVIKTLNIKTINYRYHVLSSVLLKCMDGHLFSGPSLHWEVLPYSPIIVILVLNGF